MVRIIYRINHVHVRGMSSSEKYEKCAECGTALNVSSIYLPHVGEICMKCYGEYAANLDRVDGGQKSASTDG